MKEDKHSDSIDHPYLDKPAELFTMTTPALRLVIACQSSEFDLPALNLNLGMILKIAFSNTSLTDTFRYADRF